MGNTLRRERFFQTSFLIILIGLFVTTLIVVDHLLISSVLAFVTFYLFEPIINRLERNNINRSLAITLLFILLGILFAGLASLVYPLVANQVETLKNEIPQLAENLSLWISNIEEQLGGILQIEGLDLGDKLRTWLLGSTSNLTSALPELISGSLTVIFLSPFLAFFMLLDGQVFKRSFLNIVPNHLFEITMYVLHEINQQIGGFIRARLVESLIIGIFTWVGMTIISFPYAFLISAFASLMNLIPYVGPVIGFLPAAVIVFIAPEQLMFESAALNFFTVSVVYLIGQLFDALIIIPIVVARIVNLHPVTVILAITIGAQSLGVLGMIISIPLTSILKLLGQTIYNYNLRPS